MKILIANTYDLKGGASRAAYRLLCGLAAIGINSTMLVLYKLSTDSKVIGLTGVAGKFFSRAYRVLDSLPLLFYSKWSREIFSLSIAHSFNVKKINKLNPDIVHLHWVAGGFLKIEDFANINQPIVWTLHDMWPFTGGCHYSGQCKRYLEKCGCCPVLGSNKENDLSSQVFNRKNKAWRNKKMTIISPSRWLADCAKSSSIFSLSQIHVIPNGIDTGLFKPEEKKLARIKLGLPQDKKLVLFGAVSPTKDKRKGFVYLQQALKTLSKNDVALVIFGKINENLDIAGHKIYNVGNINDDHKLVSLYSAADVFVAPSIQENLSNAVMESLSCGTPVVAFDIGGMPDMIDHQKNGWLAKPFNTDDLGEGIQWILNSANKSEDLNMNARQKVVDNFEISKIAHRHLELYRSILK